MSSFKPLSAPLAESVSNLEQNLIINGSSGDDGNGGVIGSGGDVDGMESRGSASPKSYTSHSSLEEGSNNSKFPASIRMAPIPECIRMTSSAAAAVMTSSAWNEGSRTSIASLDSHTTESGRAEIVRSAETSPNPPATLTIHPLHLSSTRYTDPSPAAVILHLSHLSSTYHTYPSPATLIPLPYHLYLTL